MDSANATAIAVMTVSLYNQYFNINNNNNKLCGRPPQYAPAPPKSWPFDLESGVQVTCDVGYLCASSSLPRPLCPWLRPNVRDRQTSDRQMSDVHHHLTPLSYGSGGIIISKHLFQITMTIHSRQSSMLY